MTNTLKYQNQPLNFTSQRLLAESMILTLLYKSSLKSSTVRLSTLEIVTGSCSLTNTKLVIVPTDFSVSMFAVS